MYELFLSLLLTTGHNESHLLHRLMNPSVGLFKVAPLFRLSPKTDSVYDLN